jgi:peptidoglycan biosynthesis protein MviN/MurJ (putative lipid II flippase)
LLFFAGIRILNFYLFARNEAAPFFRLTFLQYGLAVSFDLFYVGVLGAGAAGIPLGLLTALTLTMGIAYFRNLGNLKEVLDPTFAVFLAKNLAGAGLAALVVWGLRWRFAAPQTPGGNFVYLCVLCGAGSLVFFAALAASRAVPVSKISALWERPTNP